MGTLGGGSTSGSVLQVLWCMSPTPTPAFPSVLWPSMGQSVLVSVSGIFYVPHPTTCTKMIFCFRTCDIFCPMLCILFVGVTVHICCISYLGHPWPCSHYPFLCLKWISSMLAAMATPPLGLCRLKSFTVISYSLSCWRRAQYVTSSLLFFDQTHFLTSKCFVAWKSNSVLCTIFSSLVWCWHHLTMSFMHWSSWSVVSCSPCLMSLYISSMWFQ